MSQTSKLKFLFVLSEMARYFHRPENHPVTKHLNWVDNHQMIITAKYEVFKSKTYFNKQYLLFYSVFTPSTEKNDRSVVLIQKAP